MLSYILRRLLAMTPTLLLLLFLVVVMVRLIPGDAIDALTEDERISQDDREALEKELGLNDSLPVQYFNYATAAAQGDLGHSLRSREPVTDLISSRAVTSIELAMLALAVSTSIAIPLGVISAVKQDTILDYGLRSVALVAISVPSFAIGTAVMVFPAIWFGWTPPIVFQRFSDDPVAHFSQFIIPGLILGLLLTGTVTRLTRTMMLEVLRQDYVRTARSKGLVERKVLITHALRNALIPVLSVLGLQVAALISGSVIMENIFALPGVGRLLIESISSRDYPIIQGVTLMVGVWVMLVNLAIDVSYGYVDPRIRVGRRA